MNTLLESLLPIIAYLVAGGLAEIYGATYTEASLLGLAAIYIMTVSIIHNAKNQHESQ